MKLRQGYGYTKRLSKLWIKETNLILLVSFLLLFNSKLMFSQNIADFSRISLGIWNTSSQEKIPYFNFTYNLNYDYGKHFFCSYQGGLGSGLMLSKEEKWLLTISEDIGFGYINRVNTDNEFLFKVSPSSILLSSFIRYGIYWGTSFDAIYRYKKAIFNYHVLPILYRRGGDAIYQAIRADYQIKGAKHLGIQYAIYDKGVWEVSLLFTLWM